MHCDFLFLANLTLEFLCTLDVNNYKVPDGLSDESVKLKTTSIMSFRVDNSDFEIPIETLGDIFHIPTDGECNVSKSFNSNELWAQIVGENPYIATSAKVSRIQIMFFDTSDMPWHTPYLLEEITQGFLPLHKFISSKAKSHC